MGQAKSGLSENLFDVEISGFHLHVSIAESAANTCAALAVENGSMQVEIPH